MPLYHACAAQHTLVPVVNDIWACECPAIYRKQGKLFLDPARAGALDAVIKLFKGTQGIAASAKHLEDLENAKRAQRSESGFYGGVRQDQPDGGSRSGDVP